MSGFIKRVVYYSGYKNDHESIELLRKSGIIVEQGQVGVDESEYDYSGTLRREGYSEEQIREMVLEKCLNL